MSGKESWAKMGKLNGKQNENYKWEKDDDKECFRRNGLFFTQQ